jgi:hypothetical protein
VSFSIIRAAKDQNLFRPYLADKNDSLTSWSRWMCCLRVIYGLKLTQPWQRLLVKRCTGRDPDKLPAGGFKTILLLCGRRSGKSKIAGLIAAYEASLSGREKVCSAGELPMVSVVSPTRDQSRIIKSYARAALRSDLLNAEITDDMRDMFKLENRVTVRILTGTFRHVRSYSQIAVICDEICFFNGSDESHCSDTELIRSIKPSLLTTKGRLICVSTKYRPSGWAYATWKKHYGKDASKLLVWDSGSRVMNPTLSEADIDAEIEEDPAARAEYFNEWREDIADYLPRSTIEQCVLVGRKQLLPRPHVTYAAFADVSGGRQDPMALCIGHKEAGTRKVVVDFLKQWPSPSNPLSVVGEMSRVLQNYGLRACSGDRYSAEFNVATFRNSGIRYLPSVQNKSELYLDLIPVICSQEIELPDDDRLVGQLAALERRTRSGGRDSVDHPAHGHDDLGNVVAGLSTIVAKPRIRVGGWGDTHTNRTQNPRDRLMKELLEHNATIRTYG